MSSPASSGPIRAASSSRAAGSSAVRRTASRSSASGGRSRTRVSSPGCPCWTTCCSARSATTRRRSCAPARLEGHAGELAATLSGGQRKLLDFARALAARPRLLLMDEPLAGVNPTLRLQLLDHILALRDRLGITVLLVEHDLDAVMRVS